MIALAIFAVTFVFIALKAFQQLNVMHDQIWWVVPTSFLLACAEVYLVASMARYGFGWVVFPVGLGGGLGALFSMWLHRRMRRGQRLLRGRPLG